MSGPTRKIPYLKSDQSLTLADSNEQIGEMKLAAVFLLVLLASFSVRSSALAQEEASQPPGTALQPGQTRLPEDQPRATASPSIAASPIPDVTGTPAGAAATSPAATPAGQPNDAEMMKQMIELAKLNENHKLLADLDGTWSYTIAMWMAPGAPPMKSTGTAVRKSMMGGRFFSMDVAGKLKMPGADGNMKEMEFKGHGVEGYDNVKKKFVGTWMDNMDTGIMMSEGDYDPSTKTFTYTSEMEPMPGMKMKVREVLKITDKNHMTFEWYENRAGQEAKTMEINYTRKK